MRNTQVRVAGVLAILLGGLPIGATVHAQQIRDSSGVRIYDDRFQLAGPVAFRVANTPFVRLREFAPTDTGVYGMSTVTPLRNGNLAVGISHNIQPKPPSDTPVEGSAQSVVSAPSRKPTRTTEVRLFDATGHFLGRLGTYGPAIGQFNEAPQFIQEARNGEILVTTWRPAITRLQPTGELVSGARFGYSNRLAFGAGFLADHSIVLGVEQKGFDVVMGSRGKMVRRVEFTYARYDTTGAAIEQLPIVLNFRFFSQGPGKPPANGALWPGDPTDIVRAGGNNIWKFDPIVWELYNYSAHGKLISVSQPPIPRQLIGAVLGQEDQSWAFHAGMHVDEAGRLWFRAGDNDNAATSDFTSQTWSVYDVTGKYTGTVTLPAGLRIVSIQKNSLFGIYREADGAPQSVAGFQFQAVGR